MNKLLLSFSIFCFLSVSCWAQNYSISGYLRDAKAGEELLFGNIAILESSTGVTTNEYGFYSLTLPAGTYKIQYSYVGYQAQVFEINLNQNIRKDVELQLKSTELQEVVVLEEQADKNVKSTEMSVLSIDMKEAKLIPVLFGEQDILKTLQLMPGVSASSEGNSGFFVRGGDVDQNLILLDEAPVYNAAHLLGFFSVFNSDALKDVKLYKGGIPAQYGGRISSVLDVRMKNGNTKGFEVAGGIGLIASRLTIEGPIVKDKGSFMVSGRRTYADVVLAAISKQFRGTALYFYDLNLKANYKLGKNDRIYLSGYFGRDVFGIASVGFDWGNGTGTLRWNHIFNEKLFANSSFVYSNFNYGFKLSNAENKIKLGAGISDYNLKQDYSWFVNPKNSLQFGWNGIYRKFQPGEFTFENKENNILIKNTIPQQQALEGGIYMSNQQKVSEKLSLHYGLRLSSFHNIGPYTVYTYNEENEITSSTRHPKGKIYQNYLGVEPRINAVYLLNEESSIKASFNRNYQYLHLLSNSTSGTPTDLWVPSSPLIKPEIGDQLAVGYFRNFLDNLLEFSFETFYKQLYNQVDYEDGAQTFFNEHVEGELVFGKGRAYGAEFFLRKKVGVLTGWVSYSLLKSERKFDAIDKGNWFSARQDRTHDVSLVAMYQINKKLTLAGTWVYSTGDAVTFPTGKYTVDGNVVYLYSKRNADRMPNYHRMDLSLTWIVKDKEHWYSDINFSIYNLYNRKNAYSITFRESTTNPGNTEAVRLALFGVVPSITWNFRFK